MAYNERFCLQCGADITLRKSTAQFCSKRHARSYRDGNRHSNYEPPGPTASNVMAESRADATFRAQLANHQEASEPLTDYERMLVRRQKRNPGVLIAELAKIQLARAIEQQQREIEEAARHDPLRVEDPLDRATRGHLARRAIQSRSRQGKPADPHIGVLRPPGQSGHGPWDDSPQCIQAPWSRSRW